MEIQSRLRRVTGQSDQQHHLHHDGRSHSFSSSPPIDEVFHSDDESNSSSAVLEREKQMREEVEMMKQKFNEEKERLELEGARRNGLAVQEWMREVMEKERLKKERELERMEKEGLIRELEIVRLEQEKVLEEQKKVRKEEQIWIQEKALKEQKILDLERRAQKLENDRIVGEHKRLQNEEQELLRREEQERQDEVLRLKKLHTEKVRERQMQADQRNDWLLTEAKDHLHVVAEQQQILDRIMKERRQEVLNQQLIRNLCSHNQPAPVRSVVQSRQRFSIEEQRSAENLQTGFNCWEKVQRRKKHSKCENQSNKDTKEDKIIEEAHEVVKRKEFDEQLKRRSRKNTHQKVLLVPNFTEETVGPNLRETKQKGSAEDPRPLLAIKRRQV